MNTFFGQGRVPFGPCSWRYYRRKHRNIKIQSKLNTICVAPRQHREGKAFDSSRKKKRKKIDDDSDWELEDHISSYDSDDSDDVGLWTSNADNVDGESDGSDYELGSLLKKKSAKRKKAKKKDGLRCNECLNSQKPYDPEEGSKVSNLYHFFFLDVDIFLIFFLTTESCRF